jgi:hypothetical protein
MYCSEASPSDPPGSTTASGSSDGGADTGTTSSAESSGGATNDTSDGSTGDRPQQDLQDPFGITKIYQTTPDGREYYMNMDATTREELEDGGLMDRFNSNVVYNSSDGGYWTVDGSSIRFVMTTPDGEAPWRNVEMTMEVRMRDGNLLQPYARGEQHTNNIEGAWHGSANKHRIWFDAPARIGYMKELYHHTQNHGYAQSNQAVTEIGDSDLDLRGQWIRIKAITYNIDGDQHAKFETWVDLGLDNNWLKVTEYVDDGGWHTRELSAFESFMDQMRDDYPDSIPRNRDTGEELRSDEVITWGGDYVSWRSDGATWDFRNLSTREIGGPPRPF